MTEVEVFAPAKINLTLAVRGRREDGYHLLESLVVFATDTGDRLTLTPAQDLSLGVSGPQSRGVPVDARNLVLRAAECMRTLRQVASGADIRLHKELPHGGGIGGGSSDAAACIRGLATLWGVSPLSAGEAVEIGADVPVCLDAPTPQIMRGIGEILGPAPPLPEFFLVLVNPGIEVPTAEVFARHASSDRASNRPARPGTPGSDLGAFVDWLGAHSNDLAASAIEMAPDIAGVLRAIKATNDCGTAGMSGSGSTCWGLFASRDAADSAAAHLEQAHPEWWIRSTAIAGTCSVSD